MSVLLPDEGDLDGTPTIDGFKAAIGALRNFLARLVDTDAADTMAVQKKLLLVDPAAVRNLNFAFSFSAGAMTVAAKDGGGTDDPSADSPVLVVMRSSNAALGKLFMRKIAAALSMAFSSGCTFGLGASSASYIYLYLLDNGGALELAASATFFGAGGIASTTAMSGSATSAAAMYSTTARTSLPFRCAARIQAPQSIAGTYAATPTAVEMWPWVDPGASVQAGAQSAFVNQYFPTF